MKKVALICGTAILALTLSGCAGPISSSDTSPVGTWGVSDTAGEPYLELAEDGAVSGSDGCNRLVGTWKMVGTTIEFGPLGSTKMACPDVETWLGDATAAVISAKTMTITDSSDKVIGTLDRK